MSNFNMITRNVLKGATVVDQHQSSYFNMPYVSLITGDSNCEPFIMMADRSVELDPSSLGSPTIYVSKGGQSSNPETISMFASALAQGKFESANGFVFKDNRSTSTTHPYIGRDSPYVTMINSINYDGSKPPIFEPHRLDTDGQTLWLVGQAPDSFDEEFVNLWVARYEPSSQSFVSFKQAASKIPRILDSREGTAIVKPVTQEVQDDFGGTKASTYHLNTKVKTKLLRINDTLHLFYLNKDVSTNRFKISINTAPVLDVSDSDYLADWSNVSNIYFNRYANTGEEGAITKEFYFDAIFFNNTIVLVYSMFVPYGSTLACFKKAISEDLGITWTTDGYDFSTLGTPYNGPALPSGNVTSHVDTTFGLGIDYQSRRLVIAFRAVAVDAINFVAFRDDLKQDLFKIGRLDRSYYNGKQFNSIVPFKPQLLNDDFGRLWLICNLYSLYVYTGEYTDTDKAVADKYYTISVN